MSFDFKSYHLRGIHAETVEEKQKINQELKDFYNSLTEEEKRLFNLELQKFLAIEMGRLGSDYQAIENQVPTE
jgi:ClpP class serine protease